MACLDENLLLDLSEGTLGGDALAGVELHLDGCERCRQLVAELIRVDQPAAPSSFRQVDPAHYVGSRELARGGMGRIRLARDLHLDRDVAIKEMLPGASDQRRFEREARLTARLQHPSIVKVLEAGRWPSGEPFYAMPHIKGRSLEKVIAEATTLELRLALLPHVLAVADALASAHAEGIIHRDLKPSNVLVGSFGETVIIDWGLAKDLGAPADPEGPSESGLRSADETAAGTVVGTPAYMPPEQALGQPLDARADVYALGAMLDHLLAGRRAYGGDGLDTLEQVKRGPPPPLSQRAPGAPLELVAIVERAMSRAPAARYASALEFAADLRRYLTGQLVGAHRYSSGQLVRRWVLRHRAAVGVTAVAAVVLLVLGGVAVTRVLRAQRVAENSRADAENLLDFILGDLHTKLLELGRLDLMEDTARSAARHYEARDEGLAPAELARAALARQHLGEVLDAQGQLELALVEHRAAVRLAETAAARDPGGPAWQLQQASSRNALGKVLEARGDRAGAEAEYRRALALREAVAARGTAAPRLQAALADSHERLGGLFFTSDQAEKALAEHRLALALREAAAATEPTDAELRNAVATARGLVADALCDLGRVDEGLALYRSAQEMTSALVAAAPQNVKLRRTHAVQHERLGDLLLAQGQFTAAAAEYEESRALHRALVETDGSNLLWLHDLAYAHDGLGDVQRATGTANAALEHYRQAAQLRARAAALDPSNAWRRRDVSISHDKVGEVLALQGDAAGALAEFEQSFALREALVATDPANELWAHDLMASRDAVGTTLLSLHQLDRAGAQFSAERAFCEAAWAKTPDDPGARADLSASRGNLGDLALARGDGAGALAHYTAALGLLAPAPGEVATPANTELRQQRSQAHEKQGQALLATGDSRGALAAFREALTLARGVAEDRPGGAAAQRRLGELTHTVERCCRGR